MSSSCLLDTCAAIWISKREPLVPDAMAYLARCRAQRLPAYVSSVTAWEMALLISKGRMRETKTARRWYGDFLTEGGFTEQPVTTETFIASCFLPEPLHKDPIDRILIATAREHDLTIITRDRAILAYGAAGHVRTLAC
ncbi:type II toxin-antitoxin system VapC family toxin [Rhizobium sp. TH2]|nr:type II toxin-antitoxin system VapC family toxin [Rhizobium sp. TH2]UVC06915.1 type II toxin-antitoxin system VapC family toxin [Rhizobium sp. TH2]